MTITESVHSILASDAEPIRMYKWSGSAPARGIIQIAHGMGEHARRYRPIAHALVSAGYTVYANDHRGHGEFAAQANVLGDFGPGGFPVLVDDMARVTQAARAMPTRASHSSCWATAWGRLPRSSICSIIANCWTVSRYPGQPRSISWAPRQWRVAGSSRISMHLSSPREPRSTG